ncbi:MAG: WG repeat-containing protein [Planctomycetaceae bacterium]|jgi:hypothetical protein|nr:WG repeat-containing protein [Planctomycetaceae bacterium]
MKGKKMKKFVTVTFGIVLGLLTIGGCGNTLQGLLAQESKESGSQPYIYNGKIGLLDKEGVVLVPAKYDYVEPLSGGLISVRLNGKWGFVDKTGKEVTALKYDDVNPDDESDDFYDDILKPDDEYRLSEGLVRVTSGGKWGFIDKTGREITPLKYDECRRYYRLYPHCFSEGLVAVSLNRKWGCINNKTGKEVIPLKYDRAYSFHKGLARVSLGDKRGFIDKTGKECWWITANKSTQID